MEYKRLKEAIVLAGGFGTRLQSVVQDVPKPMALVADKPFLHYVVQQLKKQKIHRIILSIGYKSESIIEYFDKHDYGVEILYQIEKEPLGTGGGIKYALELAETEDVLVLNGDTYFDINFHNLYEQYLAKKAKACLALRQVENANRYGKVNVNEKEIITSFSEKSATENQTGLINGGTYILNKEYFNQIQKNRFSIEQDFFEVEVKENHLAGKLYDDYFIDIGIPADYEQANIDFKEKTDKGFS